MAIIVLFPPPIHLTAGCWAVRTPNACLDSRPLRLPSRTSSLPSLIRCTTIKALVLMINAWSYFSQAMHLKLLCKSCARSTLPYTSTVTTITTHNAMAAVPSLQYTSVTLVPTSRNHSPRAGPSVSRTYTAYFSQLCGGSVRATSNGVEWLFIGLTFDADPPAAVSCLRVQNAFY